MTIVAGTSCDRRVAAEKPASNALARVTPAAAAPGEAAPCQHGQGATCAHADAAAIERPVTNFASALGDLAAYQQGPRELWRLTPGQLSNIVTAALKDEAASLSLFTDTLKLQSGADNYGNPMTNAYRPILEYVLARLWRESPFVAVRYEALQTLMIEYVNTMRLGDSAAKYEQLSGEIDLGETIAEDMERGITLRHLENIEARRLYAAAVRGDEAAYEAQVARIERKWKDADMKSRLLMYLEQNSALNYMGTPPALREKYLPAVLSGISLDDIRKHIEEDTANEIARKKSKYGIK